MSALHFPVRVLAIDDHPAMLSDVISLIEQQPGFIVCGACGTVKEALELIDRSRPDLLLLDINLTDGTGFDILEQIKNPQFKVIFLTAYNQHAIRAIKFGALDYLVKPLIRDELIEALNKVLQGRHIIPEQASVAQRQYELSKFGQEIMLGSQQDLRVITFDEILYCKGDAGNTAFHLIDGKKITSYRYLKEYEEMLPASEFVRPHQSYLVNRRHIVNYHRKGVLVLQDGTEIPVSTRRKDEVKYFLRKSAP